MRGGRDLCEELLPIRPVRQIVRFLRQHGQLRGEGAVGEHKRGGGTSPALEVVLGVLDEDVQGVGDLLHDAKEVHILTAVLRGRPGGVLVLLVHVSLVRSREQSYGHVDVVGHLDGSNKLGQLIAKVLAPRRGHHKVMLHGNGETLTDRVPGKRALALGENAGRSLVWDTRRDTLVKTVHVPF